MNIIVLIILAAISINAVLGENGIIKKAQKAKELYNNGVISEGEALNKLLEEYNDMMSEGNNIKVEMIEKDYTSLTVKVVGDNLSNYQFSLDGVNWSEEQASGQYCFSGLNKVTVDATNYDTVEYNNRYTVYAKAKNIYNGKEVVLDPIQDSTIIEVVGNESDFKYTDLGSEIVITGYSQSAFENISSDVADAFDVNNPDVDVSSYITMKTIAIPSYINGKPVTKLSENFVKENISKGFVSRNEEYDLEYIVVNNWKLCNGVWDVVMPSYKWTHPSYVNHSIDGYDDSVVWNTYEDNNTWSGKIQYLRYFDYTASNYLFFANSGNLTGYANETTTNLQNNVVVLDLQMKVNSNHVIIPNTVKEIVADEPKTSSVMYSIDKVALDIELPEEDKFKFKGLYGDSNNVLYSDQCIFTFVGTNNIENIKNKAIIEGQMNISENYQLNYKY